VEGNAAGVHIFMAAIYYGAMGWHFRGLLIGQFESIYFDESAVVSQSAVFVMILRLTVL